MSRKVAFEKNLKRYAKDPLPTVTKLQLFADIFPAERRASSRAFVTLVNKTHLPISRLLLDGDQLSAYEIKYNGSQIPFTNPLIYPRARFSLLSAGPRYFHVSTLPSSCNAWQPGDTAVIEVNSTIGIRGFSNGISRSDILHNGTAFDGGLPEMGYDDDEELMDESKRKEYQLPEREHEFPPQNDSVGQTHLIFSRPAGRFSGNESTSVLQRIRWQLHPEVDKKMDSAWKGILPLQQNGLQLSIHAIVSANYSTHE